MAVSKTSIVGLSATVHPFWITSSETERARQIEEVSLRYFTDVDLVGEVQEEAGADGADDGVVEAIRDGVVHIRRNLAV